MTPSMKLVAAVPVKDLVNAKQRLVPALSPAARRELARAMLADVLAAAAGVGCWAESANRGHTAAVAFAQEQARARGAERFLTIPGDVPCVTADEIATLLASLEPGGVVFVPSRSGLGTNAALLAPPGSMALTFGEPSFANHLTAARSAGLVPRIVELPGIGLDVDAPDDLPVLLERGPHTRSAGLLRGFRSGARPAGAR